MQRFLHALALLSVPLSAAAIAQDAPELIGTPRVLELQELDLSVVDERRVQADGRVLRRTYEQSSGAKLDLDALRAADHALGLQRRGKMTPALHEAVDTLPAGERLQVAFWLVEPDDGRDLGAELRARLADVAPEDMRAALDGARALNHAAATQRYAAGNRAFAERTQNAGGELVVEADLWPVVIAEVDALAARELASDPRVDEAYLSQPEWFHEGDNAQGTLRTPIVWDQGVSVGAGVKVLVNDTAQVDTNNIYLPPIIELNNAFPASHATGVAGNIANIHPQYRAAAHTIDSLYTAGGSGDSAAPAIWSSAIATGIDFGNCSWWNGLKGSIAFLDRFFDHTVRNQGVMMFKSNGNQGNSTTPYGTTPGNGFNVICSGAYLDQENLAWEDDLMSSSSSFWDPSEGHSKPELASPGTCVATTTVGNEGIQGCFGGTSSASPLTTGVATLIAAGEPQLLAEMTTLKAVLMASAWHNIEGDALLSEKDGAGGVHAPAAWATVRDGQWWHDELEASDFNAGLLDIPVELVGGDEVRIVGLWFSNPNAAFSTDVLEMDVDMTVLAPSGGVVASSASSANAFEIAAFVPEESGTYTVRLTQQRFDGVREPFSLAWSTRADTATATFGLADFSGPLEIGQVAIFEIEERFEGPGRSYFAWASLSGAPGVSLPDGVTGFPIGIDNISNIFFASPGFIADLDGDGRSLFGFGMPNAPNAVGLELHFGAVVLGPSSQTSDILTIAPDETLSIGN